MPAACPYQLESEVAAGLRAQDYHVHILPKANHGRSDPLSVVAFGESGEIRTIRIRKGLSKPRGVEAVERRYMQEIAHIRSRIASAPRGTEQPSSSR